MTNNTLDRNTIVAKTPTQSILFSDYVEKIVPTLISNNNYFTRPIDDNIIMGAYIRTPSFSSPSWTLAQWKTYSSQDANSIGSPFAATDFIFDYNATSVNKIVTGLSGWKSLDNVSVTSYTLLPYTSIILIK
jgi:hypothetical protein